MTLETDARRRQLWGKKYGPGYIPLKMTDPKARALYMPMYKVNAAPLAVDRRVFAELGGFNQNFSCVGDSGIDFDFEYSIRCVSPEPRTLTRRAQVCVACARGGGVTNALD